MPDLSSISTFIYTMIQTNLAFASTIWKHVIGKNLDYLFQNVFTESKASWKHSSNFWNRVLIRFLYNTRCSKINQMVALRMYSYSLISIHKSASREMLSECLIIWVGNLNYEHLKHLKTYLNKGLTTISKLQMQFTGFVKVFKIIENLEIWVWSDCYWYIWSLTPSY